MVGVGVGGGPKVLDNDSLESLSVEKASSFSPEDFGTRCMHGCTLQAVFHGESTGEAETMQDLLLREF